MIKDMKTHLKRGVFPHYFVHKWNWLDAVPKHRILQAQEKFHRLLENLVPYVMVTVKRLHFDSRFYPKPDMEKLYEILTSANTLQMLNPDLLLATGGGGGGSNDNPFIR